MWWLGDAACREVLEGDGCSVPEGPPGDRWLLSGECSVLWVPEGTDAVAKGCCVAEDPLKDGCCDWGT